MLLAARSQIGRRPTANRIVFNDAGSKLHAQEYEEAIPRLRAVIECGDLSANYELGFALLELGDAHGAYRHLRAHAKQVPGNAWNWCMLGKACVELGETKEARQAFKRAIALERACGANTEAADELACLEDSLPERRR